MDSAARPSKISRVDRRYRHLAQEVPHHAKSVQERRRKLEEEEEGKSSDIGKESSSLNEKEDQPVMGRAHKDFHRRQQEQQTENVLTVVVNVVATVDSKGNVIAQETLTPGVPTVPAVPAVPTAALPSVPAVPAFPSQLTVPAYPFPSGVDGSSQSPIASTGTLDASPTLITALPSSQGLNSTVSNSRASTSSSLKSSSSRSASSLASSLASSRSSSTSTRSSSSSASTSSSSSTVVSSIAGGGYGPVNTATIPAATSTAASGGSGPETSGPLDTPKVVGSVVGSLAGVALLLAVLLFLIRRHKRQQRGGALQLPGNDNPDNQPIAGSGQQMATRSSFVPVGAPSFLNRFSGASKSTTSTSGEKSFQRISGRKLPSAFSEGMTSEQFAREGTLSGSSFYRDETGFYGGPGPVANKEFGKEIGKEIGDSNSGAVGTKERVMPSPARTPVIHHPEDAPPWGTNRNGGSTLSPPLSPNPDFPPRGTLGRSHPSHDGSRGSKFTEDV